LTFYRILLTLLFLNSLSAGEEILNYTATHQLRADGSLEQKETIRYNFGTAPRHGIYRDLPLQYRPAADASAVDMEITILSVTMDGKSVPWNIKRIYRRGLPWLRVRIGDPDRTLRGTHTYTLDLQIDPALIPEIRDKNAYWRWNLLGTGWEVPIRKFDGVLEFPPPLSRDKVTIRVYYGPRGSTSPLPTPPRWEGSQKLHITVRDLPPSYGITVESRTDASLIQRMGATLSAPDDSLLPWGRVPWWMMAVASLLTLLLGGIGGPTRRNPPEGSIKVRYEPPQELTLLQAQKLLNPSAKSPALFAALVELAQAGALHLSYQSEKEPMLLQKIRDFDPKSLSKDQRFLLESLPFPPDSNRLELRRDRLPSDGKTIKRLNRIVDEELVDRELFRDAPRVLRRKYWSRALLFALPASAALLYDGYLRYGLEGLLPSLALLFLALMGVKLLLNSWRKGARVGVLFALIWLAGSIWALLKLPLFQTPEEFFLGPLPWLGLIWSGLIYRAGNITPVTPIGEQIREDLLGYREFLTRVEGDELRKTLSRHPSLLPRGISYALLFGVLPRWIRHYRELNTDPPFWYDGPWERFEPAMYHALEQFSPRTSPDPDNFDGGGFSGGGGGGGGGGSW